MKLEGKRQNRVLAGGLPFLLVVVGSLLLVFDERRLRRIKMSVGPDFSQRPHEQSKNLAQQVKEQ
jgi:hypothetical protein